MVSANISMSVIRCLIRIDLGFCFFLQRQLKNRLIFEQLVNNSSSFSLSLCVKSQHNSKDATANAIFADAIKTKPPQCSIFSHDCLVFSGKWLFPQIAQLSKVRWAHYKHSHNQHHTLHPNDHQSVLCFTAHEWTCYMLSHSFLGNMGVLMAIKAKAEFGLRSLGRTY